MQSARIDRALFVLPEHVQWLTGFRPHRLMSAAGFLVFGDVPTWWTLTGAAVVILSGLYLLYRERKVAGPAAGPASDIASQ